VQLEVDGAQVEVPGGLTLLDALREVLGQRSVKDGCSPQGQCGCCTVLVDGAARAACVTPVRRVRGRAVTTVDGLDPQVRARWVEAFATHGASQCGFCSPGIILRLEALRRRVDGGASGLGPPRTDSVVPEAATEAAAEAVETALLAHLCRCTGWTGIVDAGVDVLTGAHGAGGGVPGATRSEEPGAARILAEWRAEIEGGVPQVVGAAAVLGAGGFADDTAPAGALVAVPGPGGDAVVDTTLAQARRAGRAVPGRRTSAGLRHPVQLPPGDWVARLRTTWVEPGYLEPDASWSHRGGPAASPLANGGAFGGKTGSPVPADAQRVSKSADAAVRVLWTREDVVRRGPKRPPIAAGVRPDGTGVVRVGWTPGSPSPDGWCAQVRAAVPGLDIEVVEIPGPPVSAEIRGAGWAEATVLAWGAAQPAPATPISVVAPGGGRASVTIAPDGSIAVEVWAGEVLDETVLRSYCTGAVHQGIGWVRSEGISVDETGRVHDLTVRSFGILTAREMPPVTVEVHREDTTPRHASDAVFAAAAAAAWCADAWAQEWPTRRRPQSGSFDPEH